MEMADWLSQDRETDRRSSTLNFSKSRTSHVISEATGAMARYSASKEDLETMCCFLDFQEIGVLPKRITYTVTDRLVSKQAPQSESQ